MDGKLTKTGLQTNVHIKYQVADYVQKHSLTKVCMEQQNMKKII